jgi:hypothetical protein
MNFDLARHNMVVHQLERRGIHDARVLEAMEWVPREEFVPPEIVDLAYEDRALPIGLEQTISQPYTVAYMCQEARVTGGDKVLEIGTGSGYGAAVLSLLAREVHRLKELTSCISPRGLGWPGWGTTTCVCIWTMARWVCRRKHRSMPSSAPQVLRLFPKSIRNSSLMLGVSSSQSDRRPINK